MGLRGRSWVRAKKKALKKKLKEASKSEKALILKQTLTQVGESYQNLIGIIPDVEARIKALEDVSSVKHSDMTEHLEGVIGAWKKVLKDLHHVRDRPRAMKLFYAKRVQGAIKNLKKKYPDE